MTVYPTSYFSAPAQTLDPTLFEGRVLRSWVRTGILSILNDFLGLSYRHAELWAHPWLAGSGVSYQWEAGREPRDLDCLVGVDFVQFRKANPEFAGLTDKEISAELNEQFKEELQGQTENWNGYELTFYVNPKATDIRAIKPYAAYDLKYDEWTVTPDPSAAAPINPEWDRIAEGDAKRTESTLTRFNAAKMEAQMAHSEPLRRNAEVKMAAAAAQGNALFTEIHNNRSLAFSQEGQGYDDFHNYRWQAGKRAGTIQKLRSLRDFAKRNYVMEMPDADTLVRRAAVYRNK
jgi:hypothetical protein